MSLKNFVLDLIGEKEELITNKVEIKEDVEVVVEELDVKIEIPTERVVSEKTELNFVGSFNYTPDPIEYNEGSIYKNINEGVAYIRKGLLWEELVRDGKPGRDAARVGGSGVGVAEVKSITGMQGFFSSMTELNKVDTSKLQIGSMATVNGQQVTWRGAGGGGWVAKPSLKFRRDAKQVNTAANTPTISYVVNSGATAVTNPRKLNFADGSLTSHVLFNGVPLVRGTSFPNNLYWQNYNIHQKETGNQSDDKFANVTVISFITDSLLIETATLNGANTLRVCVDDEPIIPFANATGNINGNYVRTLLTFPNRATRKINLIFDGGVRWWEDGAITVSKDSFIRPVVCRKSVFFGDSYLGGYTITNSPAITDFFGIKLAWRLGVLDGYQSHAIGGTGYTALNGVLPLRIRAEYMLSQSDFDDAYVFLGINDSSVAYVSEDVIGALSFFKSKVKNCFAFSRFNPKPGASIQTIPLRDSQFLSDVNSTGSAAIGVQWFSGTGWDGNPKVDGNSDWCVGSDSVHPTVYGQEHIEKTAFSLLLASELSGFLFVDGWTPT